jgi:hypothetical protein
MYAELAYHGVYPILENPRGFLRAIGPPPFFQALQTTF